VDLFSQIVIWRRIMPIGAQISVTGTLPHKIILLEQLEAISPS